MDRALKLVAGASAHFPKHPRQEAEGEDLCLSGFRETEGVRPVPRCLVGWLPAGNGSTMGW